MKPTKDKEVRYKVMHLMTLCTNGQPHQAWVVSVEGEYRATFRFESDKDWFLNKLREDLDGKLIEELPYNMNSKF